MFVLHLPLFFFLYKRKTEVSSYMLAYQGDIQGKRSELTPPAFTGKPGRGFTDEEKGLSLSTSCSVAGSPFTDGRVLPSPVSS